LSSGSPDEFQLASVTVAYEHISARLAPELADRYMENPLVATVRVEQAIGVVVYRVDVPGGDLALAPEPAARVSRELGLPFRITGAELLKRHQDSVCGHRDPPCGQRS
jgi:hypothetical protein